MATAVYPGTFDPMTNGHLDLVSRAAAIFEEVVVAIAPNATKNPLFSQEERMSLARQVLQHIGNARVDGFDGLLVDYASRINASVIVRGLRAVSDFEFEFQMALANRKLNDQVETIFLMPNEECTFISSSIVKDIARYGGNCSRFVPENVQKALEKKFGNHRPSC